MRAFAVIGAAFGDEGKGAAADALAASSARPIVVRFNGGAQAGHTVVTPGGVRHVFSHFGSGALAGAPTYLSSFFVVNPRVFLNEWAELIKIQGADLRVTINPQCLITTPWDVMLNRWAEIERGNGCHGSVGIGVGETIERQRRLPMLADILGKPYYPSLRRYFRRIQEEWVPQRMKELGIPETPIRWATIFNEVTSFGFLDEIEMMSDMVSIGNLDTIAPYDTVIFEGAQGLLLDQKYGYKFPHVTRSNTGLENVMALASAAGIPKLDVRYITRAYTTRHGAGPLDGEIGTLEGINVVDPTNGDKPWQGPFRLAPVNAVRIGSAIESDLRRAKGPIEIIPSTIITCMDHVQAALKRSNIRIDIRTEIGLPVQYETWGPSSREVVK